MSNKETQKASSKKMKPGIKIVNQAKERAIKGAQKIISKLPNAVEKSPFLQNTLTMIMDMQQQARSIKKDANEEVHKLLEVLQHSYHDVESQATKVKGAAKKQAKEGVAQLLKKWDQKKDKLPQKFVKEMDQLLSQVGLVKNKKPSAAKPTKPAAKNATKTAAKKQAPKTTSAKGSVAKAKTKTPSKKASTPKKLVIRKVVPATTTNS